MKRMVGFGLLISGVALIGYAAFQIHWHHASAEKALAIAEEMITTQKESDQADSESVGELYKTGALRYQVDDVIGILSIPALEETYPIIEGTEEQMLARGVGHYPTTALPGGNEQILLSGHRGTVFQRLGELQPGDRFIIEMGYGRYEYAMHRATIVAADDTTIIAPQGEEVLTLSTCYPFGYIGSAPDRYIIYAHPIAASNDQPPQPAS